MVEGFEVGRSYEGHPSSPDKVAALGDLLDKYGNDQNLWLVFPEINQIHASTFIGDFGRGPLKVDGCHWGPYGVLKEKPSS